MSGPGAVAVAALDPRLTWFVSRAAGMVAWLLCAAAVIWGLVLSTKLIRRRGLPAWLLDLHTFLGTLALVFTAIHMGALALDRAVSFGWEDLFVPMASRWKPGAVAWGIVATYLLVAVQVSSWLRRRLPKKVWHAVHLSSFGLLAAGTVHGFAAGSDQGGAAFRGAAVIVLAIVVLLMGSRFLPARGADRPRVPAAARTRPGRPEGRPALEV